MGTNLVACDPRKRVKKCEIPPPLLAENGCEQVESDVNLSASVTWQHGQYRSTEKAKS